MQGHKGLLLRWETKIGDTQNQQIQKSKASLSLRPPPIHSHLFQLCRTPALCLASIPGTRQRVTVPVLMDQMRHMGWAPPIISNKSHRGKFTGE